ncbi:MAG: L-histidine N(alpha)-methyltransferase [Limisphaerales bacterium]
MNTLTISKPRRSKITGQQILVEPTLGDNAWYQGYEMGMAFCRLTEQLSFEPGTKVEKELRCLERTLEQAFSNYRRQNGITLIDLGTGDGQKMVLVIKALNEAGNRPVRYVPVDTNPYIARYAILTILGEGKKAWNKQEVELLFGSPGKLAFIEGHSSDSISIEALVHLSASLPSRSDVFARNGAIVPMTGLNIDFFEHLPKVVSAATTLAGTGMKLFCMLGNTFGNYSREKRTRFLTALYAEMAVGELFLLGISLRPDGAPCPEAIRSLENEYLPGEAFMRLGADHPQSKYCLRYDPDSHSMIHTFERPDKSIQEVGYSHLFDLKELVRELDRTRFEVLSSESYPSPIDGHAPSHRGYEPRYLTILVRKIQ